MGAEREAADPRTGRRSRPTIVDVAARAGVSVAAVSFAMNGRPGVAEGTRQRILEAAAELEWHPSAPARALTLARARAIGLVLTRPTEQLEADPFFVRFLAGVERTLARTDHALVLRVAPGAVDLDLYGRFAAAGRVDGFLVCDPELGDPRFDVLVGAGLPAVVAGRPAGACPFPFVETEHARGVAAAVEHLVALGHRSVAFVGGLERHEHVQARVAAWRAVLAGAGLPAEVLEFASPGDPSGAAATARALDAGPTAIVFATDAMALAGLAAARERGIGVPGELSIVGFDDSPSAALAGPPLTSVRVDYAGFGEAAAATLLAMIAGEALPEFRPAPPELVVRASTATPAARPRGS